MIILSNIPLDRETFLRNCRHDKARGRFANTRKGCKDFLYKWTERLAENNETYRGLLEYLRRVAREEGERKLFADADHVIQGSPKPPLANSPPSPSPRSATPLESPFSGRGHCPHRDPGGSG